MILLLAALGAVAVAAIIAYLTFSMVKKWFRSNEIIDRDYVNVVLKEHLSTGKFKTVGGVFNFRKNVIITATAWESNSIDSELEELERVSVIRE